MLDKQQPESSIIDLLCKLIALAAAITLMVVAGTVCADVLGRWLFNRPIAWVSDLNRYNNAVALTGFFALCLIQRRNITVKFLGRAAGPSVSKWLDVFADVCTLLVFCALAWQFTRYTIRVYGNGLSSLLLLVPQWPWWIVITAIIYFCVIVQMLALVRSVREGAGAEHAALT